MPSLYIISGCNGAGKTTASFTFLPELLQIKEFVNADEIARGLSPFQPEKVAIEAGKIMLGRMSDLLLRHIDFAFETTLSSKTLVEFIDRAKNAGYTVSLLYFWLNSVSLATERVKSRVASGGHDIPEAVIKRRYYAGIKNLFNLYSDKVDSWLLIDNSEGDPELIAGSNFDNEIEILNNKKWKIVKNIVDNDKH
ncbi:MAG: zeta toxin family protein [Chitinophagaceae bacterium]